MRTASAGRAKIACSCCAAQRGQTAVALSSRRGVCSWNSVPLTLTFANLMQKGLFALGEVNYSCKLGSLHLLVGQASTEAREAFGYTLWGPGQLQPAGL